MDALIVMTPLMLWSAFVVSMLTCRKKAKAPPAESICMPTVTPKKASQMGAPNIEERPNTAQSPPRQTTSKLAVDRPETTKETRLKEEEKKNQKPDDDKKPDASKRDSDKAKNPEKKPTGKTVTRTEKNEEPVVVKEEMVHKLGNLDEEILQKRLTWAKEIADMPSNHDLDKKLPAEPAPNLRAHINENRCKLYETNDVPTREEE